MLIGSKSLSSPDSSLLSSLSLEVRSDRPLYAQLVDELRTLVEMNFEDGDLFYSEKTLIEQLPVSQITIRRALRELTDEGMLVPGRGRGTIIRKKTAMAARPTSGSGRKPKRQGTSVKKILGIFLPNLLFDVSEHTMALMLEFQKQGEARGIEIEFHETLDTTRLSQVFRSISGNQEEEAFVLHTPSDLTHLLYHALDNRGYRSVAMEGVGPDYPGQVVATDAVAAVRIGMDYLRNLGHSRIVLLVNEPTSEFNVQDKIHTFEQYIEEHGIADSCRVVLCDALLGRDSYTSAYEHMAEAVNGQPSRPTALFTVSDPGAWAAVKWCAQNGIRVPEEISVLGFENARTSLYMHPAISTVAHPDARLVEATFDALWGPNSGAPRHLLIPPALIVRESTAAAPQTEHEAPAATDAVQADVSA